MSTEITIVFLVSASIAVIGVLGYRLGVRFFSRFEANGWKYGLIALILSPVTVALAFAIAIVMDGRPGRGGTVSLGEFFSDIRQEPERLAVFLVIGLIIHFPAFLGSVVTSVRAKRATTVSRRQ